MSGYVSLLHLHAVTAWTENTLPFNYVRYLTTLSVSICAKVLVCDSTSS